MRADELDPSSQRHSWTGTDSTANETGADAAPFTIGQLAHKFGLTLRTLRFYESFGLISPRRASAARYYTQADHDRIALILQGKQLGFTLREIRELLAAPATGSEQQSLRLSRAQCVEQIKMLERQKHTIENALAELRRTYSSLYTRALAHETSGQSGGQDAA